MTLRERLRSAVGPCAPGIDPDRVVELVAERVEMTRAEKLAEDLQARAAALASSDGTRRLSTERSIA